MIVGLTGGIGCGKSTVVKLLGRYATFVTYDEDKAAHQCYYLPAIKEQIISLLGVDAYSADSELNRQYVANKIFKDTKLLHEINSIFKPVVRQEFESFIRTIELPKIIVLESALLFESGYYTEVDQIITVDAPEAVRISRLLLRNPKLTTESIRERMNVQFSQNEKKRNSQYVIYNNGSISDLENQVIDVARDLSKNYFNIQQRKY